MDSKIFGSHFSHGATLDQVRGMRLPPGEEGSGQGFSLSSLPLQMGQVPCTGECKVLE